ncbi:hypothetical protein PSCICO_22110 [Pseudomonas cichorii]|uniref:DUF2255 family protein n=1 Tax=Pseudomonas cichorii TaxID=36746 RepID=UPI00191061DA|nr:DUF2255 family protein [Pseudomonas cichorii]GFM86812.1 hypothetical protein PSCICO_22110 [Pseudomonas cichorii]
MSKSVSYIKEASASLLIAGALVFSSLSVADGAAVVSAPAAPDKAATSYLSVWRGDDLNRIIKADDLKISPFREDGVTYGTPTWIWCVEVDGNLYVRAYHGKASSWYKAAIREKAGRIIAAGMTRDVSFEGVDGAINERIDQAYRAKYSSSPYLADMISDQAKGATVKISPKAS